MGADQHIASLDCVLADFLPNFATKKEIVLMANTLTPAKKEQTWFHLYKQHNYFMPFVTITTFSIGMYIHITRLFLGDDLLLKYVYTPAFDMLFVLPMAYSALTQLLS
jgi:hypothetical protein